MKQHIAHMIRDRAARYGEREAFRYKDKNLGSYKGISWNDFSRESDRVSQALISLGYINGSNIGIFSSNRPEWTISDIGILATRGVVVPFFGNASKQQVKYIVDETEMKLIFVGNQEQYEKALWLLDNTATLEKVVVYEPGICADDERCMDWRDFCNLAGEDQYKNELERLMNDSSPDDLATILYTSGTTGEPKGVMLGHDNFMYCFSIHDERLDITEKDISFCFLPLSHIFERTWSFYMLYCGAVNVYLENPRAVIEELPLARPTLMCTVPRFFEKTMEGIENEKAKWPSIKRHIFDWAISIGQKHSEYLSKSRKIPSLFNLQRVIADKLVLKKLRQIFGGNMRSMPCSGAAIRPDLLRFFHATGLFINYGYGATETTASVSCFKKGDWEFDSCGTVMPGVSVKISDEGEILVKGKTVFRGYYKKPLETTEALQDGWYRTGDKGHFTNEGNLVMADRIKDLFKTSVGKYVSPQKLELLLGQDPYIEQIIVIGDNRKFVTALIVPSFLKLKEQALQFGLDPNEHAKIAADKAVNDFMKQRIEKLQEELTPYERVVTFTLLPEPFSIENMALTSTLKVRRRIIMDNYKEQIEKMYSAT